MTFDIIIKNGTIVTDSKTFLADIGIKDEKIVAIEKDLSANDAEIIDASEHYVFPGGIDVHTHFDMPVSGTITKDDFATGTIAAACGGTTMIIDFCTQDKGQTLAEALKLRHAQADGKVAIDYGFHVAITDMNEATLAEMREVIHKGYPSFKLYMTYDALRVSDDEMLQVLKQVKKHDGIICVHAENHEELTRRIERFKKEGKSAFIYHAVSRSPEIEAEAVSRVIKLAQSTGAKLYIVHATCKLSLDAIAEARKSSSQVMGETCVQYLLLSEEKYIESEAAKYMLTPPLREKANQQYLWEALKENILQAVSTDHCSFDFNGQKNREPNVFWNVPCGLPGVEARMALIYDRGVNAGKISLNRFVEIISTNPAKIFGMYPQKGAISVGSDADLVVFDPKLQKTITHNMLHENVDYTPYEGFEVTGYPRVTLGRGKVIAKDNEFVGVVGAGKFIARKNPAIV